MRNLVLFCCLIWAMLAMAPAHADRMLTFNTAAVDPLHNERQTGFLNLIFNEVGERLGLQMEVVGLPAERSISDTNYGEVDGEAYRVNGMQALYPNLIQVPERVTVMHFSAFSRDPALKITHWNNLEGLNVAYIRGWKIFEANVPKSASVTIVKNREQLFTLLQNKRIDVALSVAWQGAAYAKQLGIHETATLSQPLATKDMFIYLHNKHEDLVDDFTKALKDIKADGTYQRLYERTISPFEVN